MFRKQVKQLNETSNTMPPLHSGDDALFEALNRNKKVKKKKLIRTVVTIIVIIASILVVGVSILLPRAIPSAAIFLQVYLDVSK